MPNGGAGHAKSFHSVLVSSGVRAELLALFHWASVTARNLRFGRVADNTDEGSSGDSQRPVVNDNVLYHLSFITWVGRLKEVLGPLVRNGRFPVNLTTNRQTAVGAAFVVLAIGGDLVPAVAKHNTLTCSVG